MDTDDEPSGRTDASHMRQSSSVLLSQAQQGSSSNSKGQYPVVVIDETPKDLSISSIKLLEKPTQKRKDAVAMQDGVQSSPDFPLAGYVPPRGQSKTILARDAKDGATKNLELVKPSREPANRKKVASEPPSSNKKRKPRIGKNVKSNQDNDAANTNGGSVSNQPQKMANVADTQHSTKTMKPISHPEPSPAANANDSVPTSKSSTLHINAKGSTKEPLAIRKKDLQRAKEPMAVDSPDEQENIDKHQAQEVMIKDQRMIKPVSSPAVSPKISAKEASRPSEGAGITSISNTPKASRASSRKTETVNALEQQDPSHEAELPSPVIPQTQSPVQNSIEMTVNNVKLSPNRSRSSSIVSTDLGAGVHERQETSSVSPDLDEAKSKPQLLPSLIQSPRKIIESSEAETDSEDDEEDSADAKQPVQPQSVPPVKASGKSPIKGKAQAEESSEESSSDEESSDSSAQDDSELNSKTKALAQHPIKPKLKPSELAFADEVESSQDSQQLVQKPSTPKFSSQTMKSNAKSKPSLASENSFHRYTRLSDIALSQEQIAKAKRRAQLSASLQKKDKESSIESKMDLKAIKEDANRAALASLAKDDSSEDDSDSSTDAKPPNKVRSAGPKTATPLSAKQPKTLTASMNKNPKAPPHTNIPANRLAGHGKKKNKNKSKM